MASQVTGDGQVLPPLNISAPTPILNLRGFQWRAVDEKIHGPQPSQELEEQFSTQQVSSFQRAPAAPAAPPALPAPQLPLSAEALPTQLPGQLGHVPGLSAPPPPPFPLAQFQGAYAGNGFNMIFRPRPKPDNTPFLITPPSVPDDNILELNLTTEQTTFGGTIGEIPNRGVSFNEQPDIFLQGFPYLQTVQDVTNTETGKGDSPTPSGIHFEPGMWLFVPECVKNPKNPSSVVRMASIPHGTTINAQGLTPTFGKGTIGGTPGAPNFDDFTLDTTPFAIGNFEKKQPFKSMVAENNNTARIPQDLTKFKAEGTITTDIIKNPNLVLKTAINGLQIVENITFEVTTGPGPSKGPVTATLNGGGTANISFLAGTQNPITTQAPGTTGTPNAHAGFMTSRFWVETVAYEVNVPKLTTPNRVLLKPTMPKGSTAPTPVFAIMPPPKLPSLPKKITVPGIQIQSSQTVNLDFGPLTWPHVSVATLVPTDPQPFTMT